MAKLTNVFQKEEVKEKNTHPRKKKKWIHYTKLMRSGYQYCDAKEKEEIEILADVIEAAGEVLQDVIVRKSNTDEYEILAGHKRCAACKLLVEERGKQEFAFVPCEEKESSEVHAHFTVLASNVHHEETAFEKMHKITTLKELLENHPEEFPNIQTGRMVERLAKLCNLKRSTVGEYLTIANGLGEEAMQAFQKEEIEKSAAVTLASIPKEEQQRVLGQGIRKNEEIRQYVKENLEPTKEEIIESYDKFKIQDIDDPNREHVIKILSAKYRNAGGCYQDFSYDGTAKHITINGKKITWTRYKHLLNEYKPYEAPIPGQMEIVDTDMKLQEIRENVLNFGTQTEKEEQEVFAETEGKERETLAELEEKEQETNVETEKEKLDELIVEEQMRHYIKASFRYRGTVHIICLMCYYEDETMRKWCCYIPARNCGCNLSNIDKNINEKSLRTYLEDGEECRALSEAVWRLLEVS